MQFLESAASALNKVDALAAEVIPPRHLGADYEAGDDVLETDPGAVSTASAVEALASRLGLGSGDAGEGRDGGSAKHPGEDARGPRDPRSEADPLVTSQRVKLAGLLKALRAAESDAAEAKAARDDALASAAEARARREREASEASESIEEIEREIEAERAALEAIETESRRRDAGAGAAEGDAEKAFDAALAEAEALAASRSADARAREARARELEAEADALEKAAEERRTDRVRTAAEPAAAATAARRAETLRDALASAESELAALETREEASWPTGRPRASTPSSAFSSPAASATPSSAIAAESAAELERRLRGATEQLEAKKAETATLAAERGELERVVAEALAERRREERERRDYSDEFGSDDGGETRGEKLGASDVEREGGNEGASTRRRETARLTRRARGSNTRKKKTPTVAGLAVGVFVASAARRVDALSVRAGRRLRRSGGWRSAALLYALGLHVFAFLVLAFRALSGRADLKPVERDVAP